jgi:hypothetical protein
VPTTFTPGSDEDLVARWLQWVAQTGFRNPIGDKSGKHAARKQPGGVWFLAGTLGGSAERTCAVPAGLPLFFPVFNIWQIGGAARRGTPVIPSADGKAALDGVPLEVRPMGTPRHFTLRSAFGNPILFFPVPMPVTCWGLWVHLAPPERGPHELRFEGTDGHKFKVAVTYHLDVH